MAEHNTNRLPIGTATSVEAAWKSIQRHHDIQEKQAELNIMLTFGSPELTLGTPTASEVREIVAKNLETLNLQTQLKRDQDPTTVREQLMKALDLGLEGYLSGPVSAPREIARKHNKTKSGKDHNSPPEGGEKIDSPDSDETSKARNSPIQVSRFEIEMSELGHEPTEEGSLEDEEILTNMMKVARELGFELTRVRRTVYSFSRTTDEVKQ